MCGRAACTLCPDDVQKACGYKPRYGDGKFQKPRWNESSTTYNQYKPSYNIAPTEVLPVLVSGSCVNDESERIIQPMIWGMIPPWHKGDPKTHGLTTHNCRLESMLSSKLYSTPFSKGFRCVVVCDGFYEWQTTKGNKNKQPYYIYNPQPEGVAIDNANSWETDECDDGWKGPQLLKMAGLFQIFRNVDGQEIYSCTVITMESNETLSWLHHRTPAIFQSDDQVSEWLDADNIPAQKALELLKPPKILSWHPVSSLVNNSRNKDVECNKRITLSNPPVKRSASSSFMESWLKKASPNKKEADDGNPDEKQMKN